MTEKEEPEIEKPGMKKNDEDHEQPCAMVDNHSPSMMVPSSLALSAPSYQHLDRGEFCKHQEHGNTNGECYRNSKKSCRICLESDHPDDMIAPCRCKGTSRWVHRQCLDQWRIHETDRAFSKCTECLFDYHLEHKRSRVRKTKYYLMVIRDLCGVHFVVQLMICGFGLIASWIDHEEDRALANYINPDHPYVAYYLVGFGILLCGLGVFGLLMVTANGCSIEEALREYPELSRTRRADQRSYQARSTEYQARRRSPQQQQQRENAGPNHCCICCYSYQPSPYYYQTDPCSCCGSCCWCCTDESVGGRTTDGINDGGGGDCCQGCGGGGGGGGSSDSGQDSGMEILLIILLILAIVMAAVGFLVGIIVVVVIFQRTVQRHAYLIHKQQLTNEFQVMDLSVYDLDRPLNQQNDEENATSHPPPSAPPLPEQDAIYLKRMGLLR